MSNNANALPSPLAVDTGSPIKRMLREAKPIELIYWWVLRIAMVVGIILVLTGNWDNGYTGSAQGPQMLANLVGMFAYEIIQFFPAKNRLRFFTPRFQNITILGFFLGSFGGAFLNFYYIIPFYDKILHAFGTAEGVFVGYEYVTAGQKKTRTTCDPSIACLCALGFGFILATGWELFEFFYDQFAGGDAQHWSAANAFAAVGGEENFHYVLGLKPLYPERFSLMDTMGDIVLNFLGGIPMFIVLRLFPYHHKGKNNVNALIEAENAKG